jgi:hypothetical protein
VRRDVDDFDTGIGQELVERSEDVRIHTRGRIRVGVVDAGDAQAVLRVRGEVRLLGDPAAADQADPRPVAVGKTRAELRG